jgi:hypothetical protein
MGQESDEENGRLKLEAMAVGCIHIVLLVFIISAFIDWDIPDVHWTRSGELHENWFQRFLKNAITKSISVQ